MVSNNIRKKCLHICIRHFVLKIWFRSLINIYDINTKLVLSFYISFRADVNNVKLQKGLLLFLCSVTGSGKLQLRKLRKNHEWNRHLSVNNFDYIIILYFINRLINLYHCLNKKILHFIFIKIFLISICFVLWPCTKYRVFFRFSRIVLSIMCGWRISKTLSYC